MRYDVAIVGSGLAGLSVALSLSLSLPPSRRVVVLAKRGRAEGASDWAQGGIAAVLDPADSVAAHVRDTLVAGAGLCDAAAVRGIVAAGADAIAWLRAQGSVFTPDPRAARGYHLTREGGHGQRRIVHAADATGHAVLSALAARVRGQANITVLEDHHAVDLITAPGPAGHARRCVGLRVLDVRADRVATLAALHVVLATGGAGQVYAHTSNPRTATGDGIAMAWRAGCRVANMEFVQFHPTCLHHPRAGSFLISEALRGEGAILRLPNGRAFMADHDAREELAPRDIVARAIDREMRRHGIDCVLLDITHRPAAFLHAHFPTILARCADLGIDITTQPIPVVPAAHYACGGIVTDLAGRTDLAGLHAVGEASCSGLHGANRLASNSLLECVVMGRLAAAAIVEGDGGDAGGARGEGATPDGVVGGRTPVPVDAAPTNMAAAAAAADAAAAARTALRREALHRVMAEHVGIVRCDAGLREARERIARLRVEDDEEAATQRLTPESIELRNLLAVASLMVDSAAARRESRGAHFNRDWPATLPQALPTVLASASASASS